MHMEYGCVCMLVCAMFRGRRELLGGKVSSRNNLIIVFLMIYSDVRVRACVDFVITTV